MKSEAFKIYADKVKIFDPSEIDFDESILSCIENNGDKNAYVGKLNCNTDLFTNITPFIEIDKAFEIAIAISNYQNGGWLHVLELDTMVLIGME